MNINPGSPLYWLVTLALLVFLVGGNYLYVTYFLNRVEPAARSATEMQLEVEIRHNIRGLWTVQAESLVDYPDSLLILKAKVFAINLTLLLVFVAGFLLEIVLIYVALARLFAGTAV
jgi:hypothetical protein